MSEFLKDPMNVYTIAFVIFMVAAYRYGKKPLLHWLDTEIKKISDELGQAQTLRREAEATLEEYKKKQADAIAQAKAIIEHAKKEAEELRIRAEADLKLSLARQEQQALDRIRLVEAEALATVRHTAIDVAIAAATKAFSTQTDQAFAEQLIDQAIQEIPDIKAANAKAA